LRHCATSLEVAASFPNDVNGNIIDIILAAASNRNEKQEYFLTVNAAVA
jgi:hypothetical protein